jgi:hypothetical protein
MDSTLEKKLANDALYWESLEAYWESDAHRMDEAEARAEQINGALGYEHRMQSNEIALAAGVTRRLVANAGLGPVPTSELRVVPIGKFYNSWRFGWCDW